VNHGKDANVMCHNCGEPILFMGIKSGKFMPVDPKLFVAKGDDSILRIVLSDGTLQRGVRRGDCGHVVHFDTCTGPK